MSSLDRCVSGLVQSGTFQSETQKQKMSRGKTPAEGNRWTPVGVETRAEMGGSVRS